MILCQPQSFKYSYSVHLKTTFLQECEKADFSKSFAYCRWINGYCLYGTAQKYHLWHGINFPLPAPARLPKRAIVKYRAILKIDSLIGNRCIANAKRKSRPHAEIVAPPQRDTQSGRWRPKKSHSGRSDIKHRHLSLIWL